MSQRLIAVEPRAGMPNHWVGEHNAAIVSPRGAEKGILDAYKGLESLCETHKAKYGSVIGQDGYASTYIEDIANALISLLSMNIGRLDGGTMDKAIRDLCHAHEVELK